MAVAQGAAESADGCWSFKRVGFFKTKVTIRQCDSDQDIALYFPNTWSQGGTLELEDGRKYRATTNFWSTELRFETEGGERLLAVKTGGFINMRADVEIAPAAAHLAPPEPRFAQEVGCSLRAAVGRGRESRRDRLAPAAQLSRRRGARVFGGSSQGRARHGRRARSPQRSVHGVPARSPRTPETLAEDSRAS